MESSVGEFLSNLGTEAGERVDDLIPVRSQALGPYVIARPRANGTYRVAMEVPARIRPEGWPPTIPVPIRDRLGRLDDPDECRRIRADADALFAKLKQQKNDIGSNPVPERSWRRVNELWQDTTAFKELRTATKEGYSLYAKRLLSVLAQHPEIQPETMRESEAEAVLSNWEHSADMTLKAHVVLSHWMKKAMREGWRTDNPLSEIPYVFAESKVILWEQDDVDRLSAACICSGYPEISGVIQAVWQIGQRLTDTRQFQYDVEYRDGVFRFYQSKTNSYVTIPAVDELKNLLDPNPLKEGYLFKDPRTNAPFEEHDLGMTFKKIRNTLPEYRDRPLKLRNLRHSCVVQLARAGCDIPGIASVTGHCLATVHKILQKYLPRDNVLAFQAIEKRKRMNEGNVLIQSGLGEAQSRVAPAPGLRRR